MQLFYNKLATLLTVLWQLYPNLQQDNALLMSKLFRMQVKQKFCQGYDCGRRFGLDNSLNKTGTEITPPCFASSLTEFSGSIVYQTLCCWQ